jgi:hypothetical protein
MARPTRCVLIPLLALIVATAGAAAPPAGTPSWDQKQVLALGEKLATALRDAEAASREAPPQATALQQRKRDAALSSFRQVRQAADAYVSKLRAGWDGEMTSAYFRSVRNGMRDALQSARDAVPSPKVNENLNTANDVIAELERYYPDL